MAKRNGSVRMGPISLLTLVIVVCLAVMAVLAVTTAQASRALVDRQADTVQQTYADEVAAQRFMAALDETLLPLRAPGADAERTLEIVEGSLGTLAQQAAQAAQQDGENLSAQASMLEGDGVSGVRAIFETEGGRRLEVLVQLNGDATYRILSWKVTTQWNEEGFGDTLWSGTPFSG